MAKTLSRFRDKLIEAEKVQFESRFRGAAFSGSSAAIMMVNRDLDIMHVNDTVKGGLLEKYEDEFRSAVPDFDSSTVVGRCIDEFHPTGLRERVREILGGDPENLPYKANIALGDVRLSLDISAVEDEDGQQIGFVVEWLDVSRDYMNQALLSSIDANQVKAEFTLQGELIDANALFCKTMHADLEALVGRRARMCSASMTIWRLNTVRSLSGFSLASPSMDVSICHVRMAVWPSSKVVLPPRFWTIMAAPFGLFCLAMM